MPSSGQRICLPTMTDNTDGTCTYRYKDYEATFDRKSHTFDELLDFVQESHRRSGYADDYAELEKNRNAVNGHWTDTGTSNKDQA